MSSSVLILDENEIARSLRRIAHEILEHNPHPENCLLAGIPQRGVALAQRIAQLIGQMRAPSMRAAFETLVQEREAA